MSILESGHYLIALRNHEASEEEWQQATEEFARILVEENDPKEIITLLDEDVVDDVPISSKTAAFERLLELEVRTPEILRRFADHLWFHGPDFDERAAALNAEAERLERKGKSESSTGFQDS